MALISKQIRTTLVICMHCLILSCMGSTPTFGEKKMETIDNLFFKVDILFKINYAEAGITFIPGDESLMDSTMPGPVFLDPHTGIWLVDPGADLQSWRLLYFNVVGKLTAQMNLTKLLKLSTPSQFLPVRLLNLTGGNVFLLASRKFDHEQELQEDFILAQFSPFGQLVSLLELPDFDFVREAFMLGPNTLINLEINGSKSYWKKYPFSGKPVFLAFTHTAGSWARLGSGIIEQHPPGEYRMIDEFGSVKALSCVQTGSRSKASDDGRALLIGGLGNYFGSVMEAIDVSPPDGSVPLEIAQGALSVPAVRISRKIELMQLADPAGTLRVFGRSDLPDTDMPADYPQHFNYFRSADAIFDEKGNFYEVCWTPDQLVVYKHTRKRQ